MPTQTKRSGRREVISEGAIPIDDTMIPYRVIQSPRARRARVIFKLGSYFEVIVPKRMPKETINHILNRSRQWMQQKYSDRHLIEHSDLYPQFADGGHVPWQGRNLHLSITFEDGPLSIHRENQTLLLRLPLSDASLIPNLVCLWLRHQAETILPVQIHHHAMKMKSSVQRVTIRDQKSIWGSCSSNGTISLNWRLIMVPPDIMDYVCIHELSHFDFPNHAAAFWSRVRSVCPHYVVHRKWLRDHRWLLSIGRGLMRCDDH